MEYKEWLNNEYRMFVQALGECTVENFQEHPMVLRMLGPVAEQEEKFNRYIQLILAANPKSICEIGGGSGLLFVMLRKAGYSGDYFIYDLPEVKKFQKRYLQWVEEQTGLNLQQNKVKEFDFCVSMYALGEFDDALKKKYVDGVVKKCAHGLVLWNPHSGASDVIEWKCNSVDEVPLTSPGNKVLTW